MKQFKALSSPLIVRVQLRHSYGNERIYPMNEQAKLFVKLTGRRTFFRADLDVIRDLGFEVEWIPATI